jgi:Na+-translocating ferredoxin:NAD+ oxidoreductase RnfC subunit
MVAIEVIMSNYKIGDIIVTIYMGNPSSIERITKLVYPQQYELEVLYTKYSTGVSKAAWYIKFTNDNSFLVTNLPLTIALYF